MTRRTVTRPEIRVGGLWLSSFTPDGWGELRHATRPNGAWQVSWTIPNTRNWRHPALAYGAPVDLMLGPACLAAATLEEPDWDSGQFVALGACRDGETAVSITGAGASTTKPNTAIDAAIVRGVVSWTRVGDFGTTEVGELDGAGGLVTLQSVLDAWAQENNSNWAVDNQRNLVIAPTDESAIDWLIVPGSGVLGSASEERVDRIFVRYIATNGTRATTSFPSSTPLGGVEKPVDITDRGPMTSTKATSVAQGMWSDLQGRSGWTNGLTLKGGQITTVGGVEADLALVKGGDTARLLGVPDQRGISLHTDVVIGDTDYDWEEDEIQVNPVGLAARDAESVLEQVGNLAVDAMAKASAAGGNEPSGPWVTWTPVWKQVGGTVLSIGNGTLTGAYRISGKTVDFRITLIRGTTTNVGTAVYLFEVPVTPIEFRALQARALVIDSSAGAAGAIPHAGAPIGGVDLAIVASSGRRIDNSGFGTAPTAWADGDEIRITGTYEAA